MSEEPPRRGGLGGIGDGIRTGLGILNAFREAVEESLQEAVDRGDLSPDRARKTMTDMLQRAQGAFDDTRLRLDFVPRREFDELREELSALRERVARLESPPATGAGGTTPGGIILTE